MMSKRATLGAALMIGGALMALANLGILDGAWALAFGGAVLFGVYLNMGGAKHYKNVGLLIPACMMCIIAAFGWLDGVLELGKIGGATFFMFLALGFWMVYFVHTLRHRESSFGDRHWPAFTATALMLFANLIGAVEGYGWEAGRIILAVGWPTLLVLSGAAFIYTGLSPKSGGNSCGR